jgi:hypothetical protein
MMVVVMALLLSPNLARVEVASFTQQPRHALRWFSAGSKLVLDVVGLGINPPVRDKLRDAVSFDYLSHESGIVQVQHE